MSCRTLNLAILLLAGQWTACSASTIRYVHRDPSFRSAAIHHVLVIGIFENPSARMRFEKEFVRQWGRYGVKAETSLDVLPPNTPLTKAGVAPMAKARAFDTILVARLIEKKKISPGETAVPTVQLPAQNDLEHVFLAPPVSTSPFDLSTVETNLYDVSSEHKVLTLWSETQVMSNIPKLIPPFVKLVLKRIHETP
jgi:hypothetical protein